MGAHVAAPGAFYIGLAHVPVFISAQDVAYELTKQSLSDSRKEIIKETIYKSYGDLGEWFPHKCQQEQTITWRTIDLTNRSREIRLLHVRKEII